MENEEKKMKPWRENANSVLVVYSILAAICGIIIVFILQDSQDDELLHHWALPISLLGIALWLFIFSAEGLTDALDEDDVNKYLALLTLYNIAVICLFTGVFFTIYFRYSSAFMSFIHCNPLRNCVIIVFLILVNLRWLLHLIWLFFKSEDEYKDYVKELTAEKEPEADHCWTMFFLRIRRAVQKK